MKKTKMINGWLEVDYLCSGTDIVSGIVIACESFNNDLFNYFKIGDFVIFDIKNLVKTPNKNIGYINSNDIIKLEREVGENDE